MPILVHFKAKNNDNSYFYKNSGLSFPWVPYYLKLDKSYFNIDADIYLAGVYIWGENSPAYNNTDVDFFITLQNDINDFQSLGRVIVCGDWNARVGDGSRADYIVCDRSVDNIDHYEYFPDIPLPRHSHDNTVNSHG